MSLTNFLFTELSSFSSKRSSVYWTCIRGFTPEKLFCSKTKHWVELCFWWVRRWTMSVALRIHSSLCKITRIRSLISKYWMVFRGLHKSRSSIPSWARPWHSATSSHRALCEGCYALLIKTGRKRCDAKEDASLQKEWKMRCWQEGGVVSAKAHLSRLIAISLSLGASPCQTSSTHLTFSSWALVNLRAWKHSAAVILADPLSAFSEWWQFC